MRFVALVLLVVAVTTVVAADRCALQCYRGSVAWSESSLLDYAFSVVPCAPVLVASATLNDGGDTLLPPTFGCTASDGIVSITLDHAGGAHLEWRYATLDACETVLAALSTIPGTFVGTAHRAAPTAPAITDGASLETAQIECAATTCAPVCFDSGVLALAGVAGDKSPCGAAGTDACAVRVQYTLSLCDAEPRVTAFDVLIGGDGVRLANYQPDAVAGAQISCDGEHVHLDSAGVALAWALPADNNADCASLLLRPDVLATGNLRSAIVQVSATELWTAAAANLGQPLVASVALCSALPTEMPGSTDSTADPSPSAAPQDEPAAPAANDGDAPAVEALPTLDAAIVPSVHCSSRRAGSQCCTVFGYHNPNNYLVVLAPGRPQNFYVPKTPGATEHTHFLQNSTVAAAFSVQWSCREYLEHTLRWQIETNAPHGRWRRSADADRTRDDCSTADYNTWCT